MAAFPPTRSLIRSACWPACRRPHPPAPVLFSLSIPNFETTLAEATALTRNDTPLLLKQLKVKPEEWDQLDLTKPAALVVMRDEQGTASPRQHPGFVRSSCGSWRVRRSAADAIVGRLPVVVSCLSAVADIWMALAAKADASAVAGPSPDRRRHKRQGHPDGRFQPGTPIGSKPRITSTVKDGLRLLATTDLLAVVMSTPAWRGFPPVPQNPVQMSRRPSAPKP